MRVFFFSFFVAFFPSFVNRLSGILGIITKAQRLLVGKNQFMAGKRYDVATIFNFNKMKKVENLKMRKNY